MLDLDQFGGVKPRCLVTNIKLPNFLDQGQPPRKKRPFSMVLNHIFSHNLYILLPSTAAQAFETALTKTSLGTLTYSKIHLKLLDLITGDFFTQHIKTPSSTSLLMLSQGRPGVDPIFSLHNGVLRLEVPQPTFERLGLQGKPVTAAGPGKKHAKAQYEIELNLRLPNMLRGKRGFERIIRAFTHVLNESVTWLVCEGDGGGGGNVAGSLLEDHQPRVRNVEPAVTRIERACVPAFPRNVQESDYAEAAEVLEWLTMAVSGSQRIREGDDVDAYLSRYRVPGGGGGGGESTTAAKDLVAFRWKGLIPPDFAHKLFLAAIKASGDEWVAMTASTFGGEAYAVLVHDGQALTWEYRD